MRELTAEYVTHKNETFRQVVARLEKERPESPYQKRARLAHEAAVADWKWRGNGTGSR